MGWLILAAGRSRRFDGDKLLSCVPHSGKTLFEHMLQKYIEHGAPILVVTRPDHAELHELLIALNIDFTICLDSDLGMGTSMAWGVAQIAKRWNWVGIVLADMALIKKQTLSELSARITDTNIVVPKLIPRVPSDTVDRLNSTLSPISTNPCWGHPVLFGESYFKPLLSLSGDKGARGILKEHITSLVEVITDDSGVSFDVDCRDDITIFVHKLSLGSQ
jgi:molybdenum cofactor cytidylyltransferase